MQPAQVSLSGIDKRFGEARALRDVSLDVRDGEFLTLLGPSGCGKSTLLRIVAGLEVPTAGGIAIGGRPVDTVSPRDRGVAMVFQNYALYPHLTAGQNIAAPLVMRRLSWWQRLPLLGRALPGTRRLRTAIDEDVARAAASLDIQHLLHRRPSQLSGGQRQRVALGRAMVRHPVLFLMDEPLANLDSGLRAHMRAELATLHRRLGVTFIYVTHDQVEAMTMSDRIAVMFDGEIRQIDTPETVFRTPVDLDVAAFMTHPHLNRWPAIGHGDGTVEVTGVPVPVPAEVPRGAAVTLAFRPEDGRLATQPTGGFVAATVRHIELLGSDALIHAGRQTIGDGDPADRAVVRVDAEAIHRLTIGTPVWVAPDPARAWCFGADKGRLPDRRRRAA